ncbi:MAG TPA: GNAT family N-acetyltransferase [Solirubrobacteraceae bacterium]|nr:GNAT family N-acetyltransferase [Solirubrobacteraceae bacterium]
MPAPAVHIRAAERQDASALFALIRDLAQYERLSAAVTGSEELLAAELFGQEPVAQALVADVAGETVGFAVFFPTFSTFRSQRGIWLEDLYVAPEHRRAGIGHALLSHVAWLALERGCARLEWSALEWNEPALRFYEQLRAEHMEQWRTLRLEGDALQDLATAANRAES